MDKQIYKDVDTLKYIKFGETDVNIVSLKVTKFQLEIFR